MIRKIALVVVIGLLVAFAIRTWGVQVYAIPSESMEDTLHVGDRVAVSPSAYWNNSVQRGDLIVFDGRGSFLSWGNTSPIGEFQHQLLALWGAKDTYFVKRVVGVPGDHVVCCNAAGQLEVNGESLTEPYLYPGDSASEMKFSVDVPSGRLWVMGDHRSDSADSRSHMGDPGGGTVPLDQVKGKVVYRVWPFSQWGPIV